MIAADQRVNGHQYQLAWVQGYATVRPRCTDTCGWTGTPWRPERGNRTHIDRAAAEWHKHAATAAPITREQAAS